eukprot:1190412-Prorocentrum_minimum.AAC.1
MSDKEGKDSAMITTGSRNLDDDSSLEDLAKAEPLSRSKEQPVLTEQEMDNMEYADSRGPSQGDTIVSSDHSDASSDAHSGDTDPKHRKNNGASKVPSYAN